MIGGAPLSTKILAEGLRQGGHDVAILCADSRSTADIEPSVGSINGVRVYRWNPAPFDLFGLYFGEMDEGSFPRSAIN